MALGTDGRQGAAMGEIEAIVTQDHGQMDARPIGDGWYELSCQFCSRRVRLSLGGKLEIIDKGDVTANHWGGTAPDVLRIDVEVS